MNCHDCKFKKNLPGDAHIGCSHPIFEEAKAKDPMFELACLVGAGVVLGLPQTLGMKPNTHGFKSGWLNFPVNYDPVWLDGKCIAFEEKEK